MLQDVLKASSEGSEEEKVVGCFILTDAVMAFHELECERRQWIRGSACINHLLQSCIWQLIRTCLALNCITQSTFSE